MKLIFSVVILFCYGTLFSQNKGWQFVFELTKLGYFQYTDEAYIEEVKKQKSIGYDEYKILIPTDLYKNSRIPKDYRYYHCDGEEIYEQGGIINLLNELKSTFVKLDFRCEINGYFEEWNIERNWLNQQITINGTKYVLFENSREQGWGEAPLRIAQILNRELSKQGINEQIYLISGGNDGFLVFLTPEIYKYISSVCKKDKNLPYTLDEWAKQMNVKLMKVN